MIPTGAGPTRTRLILARNGGKMVVLESPDFNEDDGSDPLNNSPSTSTTYSPKAGTEDASMILCARYYRTDPEVQDSDSGATTEDQPRLAFPLHGTDVNPEEHDRVDYGDRTYELRAPKFHTSFVDFEVKNVDE